MSTLAGRKIGKFLVLRPGLGRAWMCICTCGREIEIPHNDLLTGASKITCPHDGRARKHPVYMIWRGMKSRCYTPSDSSYPRYGAKGVRVASDWHVFLNFFADIGYQWTKGMSLDRIDGDKDYSKENCRWATVQQQNDNRSVNHQIEIDDQIMTLQQAVDYFGVVAYKTAHARVNKLQWDPIKAASTPKR